LKASDTVNVTTTSSSNYNLAFVKYDASTGEAKYIQQLDEGFVPYQTALSSAREVVWIGAVKFFPYNSFVSTSELWK